MAPSAFFPFFVLVVAHWVGESVATAARLPLPGTVVGAVVLFVALCAIPGLHAKIAPFAHTLLRNMLLFYVPASVGIMTLFGEAGRLGPLLLAVSCVSAWATAVVAASVFDAVRGQSMETDP